MSQLLRGVIISQCLSFKITNSFKTFFLTCQSLRVWKFLNGHQSLVWLHCFWSCDPAFRVYGKLGHCPQDKLKIIKSETPFRTSKLLTFWSRIPILWLHEKKHLIFDFQQRNRKYHLEYQVHYKFRAVMAGKAGKVWSLPRFWASIPSYKKQPVKKFWGRLLDLAWLKFAAAALSQI